MSASRTFWALVVTALVAWPASADDRIAALEAQLASLQRQIDAAAVGSTVSHSSGHVSSHGGCNSGCDTCCIPCCPRSGFLFSADALAWRAVRSPSEFAGNLTPIPGAVAGVPVAGGSHTVAYEETEYDWDFGYRLGLGYAGPSGWDLMIRYTDYDTTGDATLGQFLNDADNVQANRHDRSLSDDQALNGGFDSGIVDFASEVIRVEYDTYDVELGHWIRLPRESFRLRVLGGLRGAELLQSGDTVYFNREGAADDDTYTINDVVNIRAFGPRIGGELHWNAGLGLSLFTRASLSLLYAEFHTARTDLAFNDSLNSVRIRSHRDNFDQILPITEMAIGGRFERGNFFVAGGYDMAVWFDAVQTIDIAGYDDIDGGTAMTVHDRGNFFLHGLFGQVGMTY